MSADKKEAEKLTATITIFKDKVKFKTFEFDFSEMEVRTNLISGLENITIGGSNPVFTVVAE